MVRSMIVQRQVSAVAFKKSSFPMPMDDKLTSLRMLLAFMALITFFVPTEHQRSILGCRLPRQEITASTPSSDSLIFRSEESLATSILIISYGTNQLSTFSFDSSSSTSTDVPKPLLAPSLLSMAMARTCHPLAAASPACCSRASATANFPTSPIPPLVAYKTATVRCTVVIVKESNESSICVVECYAVVSWLLGLHGMWWVWL
mmetsp:Transcript_889/g.2065  ORF Transcript_889/g.2065 Transcript_889/m.2065 type:complete len:204 (+) Transcript_889:546-1157(+)